MEGLIDALPSVVVSSFVAVAGAAITLLIANRAGIGDISDKVDKENDRLVAKQKERIDLLETQVAELEEENARKDALIAKLTARIDDLERLVSDEQIRRTLREGR